MEGWGTACLPHASKDRIYPVPC
nr:cytochrome-b5 reductase (EC 1.6.2.2) - rat [Rattus norvegicus]